MERSSTGVPDGGPVPGRLAAAVTLLAGALLVGFSWGRWLAPLAAWIGPVLIIRFARDHKAGRGYPMVLAAMVLAAAIGFWGFFGPLMSVFIAVGYGFLLSLPYLADRLLQRRLGAFAATLVYPLAATSVELLNNHVNPLGAWGMTGFSQYGVVPLMQLSSVTGMIGITFLMGWFAAVANASWEYRDRIGQIRGALVACGAGLSVVLVFGYARVGLASQEQTVRVAGVTAQSADVLFELGEDLDLAGRRALVQDHRDLYFAATVREAQAGAQVVLWPEIAGFGIKEDEAALIAQAKAVAREQGIYLAIPLYTQDPDGIELDENVLVVLDPAGEVVLEHVKYGGAVTEAPRLVGDKVLRTADTPFGVLSGVICYDLDFPTVLQQAGRNATALMLVPSKDWAAIDPVHSYMAAFRAVEGGMSLVRQTDQGLSIAYDPYGRVLAQTDYFDSTDRTMVAQVPVGHVSTVFSTVGRWFEWLCLAGLLAVTASAFRPRPKV